MYRIYFGNRCIDLGEVPAPASGAGGDATVHLDTPSQAKQAVTRFRESGFPERMRIVHSDAGALFDEIRSLFQCISAGGGLVRNASGHYLVILRRGVWDLPKGKLEKGEGFEDAALREVGEETGLAELELSHLLVSTYHTYREKGHWVLKETRWYEMRYTGSGDPVLQESEGITGYRWLKPGHPLPPSWKTWPSIRDVLILKSLA